MRVKLRWVSLFCSCIFSFKCFWLSIDDYWVTLSFFVKRFVCTRYMFLHKTFSWRCNFVWLSYVTVRTFLNKQMGNIRWIKHKTLEVIDSNFRVNQRSHNELEILFKKLNEANKQKRFFNLDYNSTVFNSLLWGKTRVKSRKDREKKCFSNYQFLHIKSLAVVKCDLSTESS